MSRNKSRKTVITKSVEKKPMVISPTHASPPERRKDRRIRMQAASRAAAPAAMPSGLDARAGNNRRPTYKGSNSNSQKGLNNLRREAM
jgi:hypothetical protein